MGSLNGLTSNVFKTGNDEKLATVDIYKQKTDKVNNTVADLSKTIGVEVEKLAALNSAARSKLSGKFFNIDSSGKVKLNANTLLAGIINANPTLKAALASLGSGSAAALSKIKGYQQLIKKYGNVYKQLKNGDYKNAAGLMSIINSVTGINIGNGLIDKGALKNLMVNVIGQAASIGLYGFIEPFISSPIGKIIGFSVIQGLAKHIVTKSLTNLMSEISTAGAGKELAKGKPDFVVAFTSKYKAPKGLTKDNYLTEWNNIEAGLNGVDPQWKSQLISNKTMINASVVTKASPDFKEMLRLKVISLDILYPSQAAMEATTATAGEVVQSDNDELRVLYAFIGDVAANIDSKAELKKQFTNLTLK